jgi:hypothetical protein
VTIISPPVNTSAYGTESDAEDAGETAENNDAADEAADDNDGDEGTGTNHLEDALKSIRGFTREHGYALAKLHTGQLAADPSCSL